MKKKLCGVVVAAVLVVGLTPGCAHAASSSVTTEEHAYQGAGWLCKTFHIMCP